MNDHSEKEKTGGCLLRMAEFSGRQSFFAICARRQLPTYG
jgi:hypothetical protein